MIKNAHTIIIPHSEIQGVKLQIYSFQFRTIELLRDTFLNGIIKFT